MHVCVRYYVADVHTNAHESLNNVMSVFRTPEQYCRTLTCRCGVWARHTATEHPRETAAALLSTAHAMPAPQSHRCDRPCVRANPIKTAATISVLGSWVLYLANNATQCIATLLFVLLTLSMDTDAITFALCCNFVCLLPPLLACVLPGLLVYTMVAFLVACLHPCIHVCLLFATGGASVPGQEDVCHGAIQRGLRRPLLWHRQAPQHSVWIAPQ